ncbi:Crp/Fnr family transcriptional regulator [Archangium lansingense]|uniref:Crp/Fnr family transcriptional regulator n=1 Tax=Archangium lansingense TaxID=2995310 RepID=A0ABT4AC81_9BACT|nr:Crp/Fnr family transcriptional regulator [Archangium lansinium]MCY1079277.1 Crp/Fnr family transcriptional regulator [Archangium lansinium]
MRLRDMLEHLAGAPLADYEDFATRTEPFRAGKGETLFSQGQHHPHAYFLRQGLVKLCYVTHSGTERTKSLVHEGQLFASLGSMRPEAVCSFSAIALEPVEGERFPLGAFLERLEKNLQWERIGRKFFQELAFSKERREHQLLVLSASERYEQVIRERPELLQRLSQAELARWIGITPVALSRIRGRRSRSPKQERKRQS